MKHRDDQVSQAIVKLNDALCSFERATGVESVFVLREAGGFFHRSVNGKPVDETRNGDIEDEQLFNIIKQ